MAPSRCGDRGGKMKKKIPLFLFLSFFIAPSGAKQPVASQPLSSSTTTTSATITTTITTRTTITEHPPVIAISVLQYHVIMPSSPRFFSCHTTLLSLFFIFYILITLSKSVLYCFTPRWCVCYLQRGGGGVQTAGGCQWQSVCSHHVALTSQ